MANLKDFSLAKVSGILLAIIAVGAGTAYAGAIVSKNNIISADAAENFALVNAGFHKNEVTSLHSHLEMDNGKYVYDIEFHVGNIEYEYEVLAKDGRILEKNIDDETAALTTAAKSSSNTIDSTASGTETEETGSSNNKADTGSDPASKEEPAAASGQNSNDSVQNAASASGKDAKDKTQSKKSVTEVDSRNTDSPKTNQAGTARDYIGVERAKQIALEHAGFAENEVIFSKAKFDKEDDDNDENPEYEIEFFKDKMEYEYDIDALSGDIIEFSAEADND